MSGMRKDAQGGRGLSVYARLALGMAAFGSATPVSKIVTSAMPVFVGSAARVAVGAVALAPFAARHWDQVGRFGKNQWVLIVLISFFGMFGFSALMLYGMKMISGVAGAVVMSTTPAVTATGSMLFMGDKPTWRKLTAIALAVVGVGLLNAGGGEPGQSGSGSEVLLGSLLVFGAVCCEAVYTLLGKKASEHGDPVLIAFLAAALAVPIFLPFAIWQWDDFAVGEVGTAAWLAVLWYGAGTLALGSWLWYSGLSEAEGAVAAGFMGVMPASALILSYVLLNEPFQWIHIAGFLIVFAGVLLVSWEHAAMEKM